MNREAITTEALELVAQLNQINDEIDRLPKGDQLVFFNYLKLKNSILSTRILLLSASFLNDKN